MRYFLLAILFVISLSAQSKPTKVDSLANKNKSAREANQSLRNEIEALKKMRDSLQQKLRFELRDLYILRYGEEDGGKVAMGQIWSGMTEEMIKDSWGEPDSITVNEQRWGKYSQWYYGEITYFFKDGVLFEWESPQN